MARQISGQGGTGSVTAYTLAATENFRLDVLAFTLTTSATVATRSAEVLLFAPGPLRIARIPDWNDVLATSTVTYTFGVGLNPFSCAVTTGMAIQHDLPLTVLEPDCYIVVRSVDLTGAVVPSDAISAVTLWVEDEGGASALTDEIPLLTPLALSDLAAA